MIPKFFHSEMLLQEDGMVVMWNDENGMTLVEILAALALSGVIITVCLSLFTDYIVMTNRVENEVDGGNLAEEVAFYMEAADIDSATDCNSPPASFSVDFLAEQGSFHIDPMSNQVYYTTEQNQTYFIEARALCQEAEERALGLAPVEVQIYRELEDGSRNMVTNTFRYLDLPGGTS
ncbi:prepilin-type N-terminal cleavage/methylation domain-containing protein [Halobacillus fulvus]|nr:prepilin-type N-terminal cleavage/methylation domain-containing protein [Halobacillus fulvus]